jgi:FkbM family methyltransferase
MRFYLLPNLGVSGAKDKGKDPETGCQILSTNTIEFFGGRQTLLKVPKDGGIYNFVRVTGQWQANDCRALAQVLDKISLNSAIIPTFLDIGGNVGLFSLQVAHMVQSKIKIQIVEPLSLHFNVIPFNLKNAPNLEALTIHPVALTSDHGNAFIYSENKHFGNTSLDLKSMGEHNFETNSVKTVKATNFFDELASNNTVFCIKIDTQGHDALILSAVTNQMLSKTRFIMVEVWSQPGIPSEYIDQIAEMCAGFSDIHTTADPDIQLTADDVRKIWSSGDGKTTDLILAR